MQVKRYAWCFVPYSVCKNFWKCVFFGILFCWLTVGEWLLYLPLCKLCDKFLILEDYVLSMKLFCQPILSVSWSVAAELADFIEYVPCPLQYVHVRMCMYVCMCQLTSCQLCLMRSRQQVVRSHWHQELVITDSCCRNSVSRKQLRFWHGWNKLTTLLVLRLLKMPPLLLKMLLIQVLCNCPKSCW